MKRPVPFRATFLLFTCFFLGLALNAWIFLDLQWFKVAQTSKATVDPPPAPGPRPKVASNPTQVEQLKQSILLVRVSQCTPQRVKFGTGFVVKSEYVATAAHVLGDQQSCGGEIQLIDARGREHKATLEGVSRDTDLAVLHITDSSLPPLSLADSTSYENTNEVVHLVTIGYPLVGVASSADRAAISGEGNISQFDRAHNVFITSGLNLNPGNSGGPVFVHETWKVLGIAVAKMDPSIGEGIGWVVPIKTFQQFFREKTGQEFP